MLSRALQTSSTVTERLSFLFPAVFSSLRQLILGHSVNSLQYDYSASIECLKEPLKPQYGGGIIRNPEFNYGVEGWSTSDHTNTTRRKSINGNIFAVATNKDSIIPKINLQQGMMYTFSAWLQVSEGKTGVRAVFKTGDDIIHAGAVDAKSGCWSMLKGGLSVLKSGPAELYFESDNTNFEIWVDSVSLQPFSQEEWRSHQNDSILKVRTLVKRFRAVDDKGNPVPNATVTMNQIRPNFPFGSEMDAPILKNKAYQEWFKKRFHYTVFGNEMKWYSTERQKGKEDYSTADSLMQFAESNGIKVRGHNILWDDPKYQMDWVKALPTDQLRDAADRRVKSVVSRYKGRVIAWDVVNENLHFRFFEDRLGDDASGRFFKEASQIDGDTLMFMNDYNVLEQPGDTKSTPSKYLEKLKKIRSYPGIQAKTAIGLEGHFDKPNIAYIRSALDTLAGAKVPIWLTEVDVRDQSLAPYLEEILREAYSHPAVNGIILWTGWSEKGCYRVCLTDNNFNNLPAGNVVDKLIEEWKTGSVSGTTNAEGFYEVRLVHGEYEMKINHASMDSTKASRLNFDAESIDDVVFKVDI